MLVDGSFSADAAIDVKAADGEWTDRHGSSHSGTIYTVTVTDPVLETPTYTVHYRLDDPGRNYTLWVQTEDGWQTQDYELDGSYLLLSSDDGEIAFCVLPSSVWLLWVAVGVLLVLVGAGAFLIRRKRRRQHQKV